MHTSSSHANDNIIQLMIDIIFLIFSFLVSYFVIGRFTILNKPGEYLWILLMFIPLWVFIMFFDGMYDKTTFYYTDRILRRVVFASIFSGLCIVTILFFTRKLYPGRLFLGMFISINIIIMSIERIICSVFIRKGLWIQIAPNIILVTSEENYTLFRKYLSKTNINYNIIGIIQIGAGKPIENLKNLGNLDDLGKIVKSMVVDEVIFAPPKDFIGGLEQQIKLCEQMGVTTRLLFNPYDLKLSRIHISMLGPIPMLTFYTVTLNPVQKALKRMMDIIISIFGLLITIVAFLAIAPAIKLDSPGPVIFKQKRVGRNGRIFNIYKFRTMCKDAEIKKKDMMSQNEMKSSLMFKIENDPRVTRVGSFLRKTSLDELPQFLNVLKGEMSLVGTRPPTLGEITQYNYNQWRRISIKPGITGMWQVSGRSSIKDFNEVVALDIRYIEKWSFWLDIYIIFKTFLVVFAKKSAY